MAEEVPNLDREFQRDGFEKSFGGEYSGSQEQEKTYEKLKHHDQTYIKYIEKAYGSYEHYLRHFKIGQSSAVYDPSVDYIMDVTVITEEASYKTDHISAQEVIMEALAGVCTVIFMKIDGSVGRITGTLDRGAMPTSEYQTRLNFFSPLRGDRVVVWDIDKQGWRSFYMDKVIKFVRDDTIALE